MDIKPNNLNTFKILFLVQGILLLLLSVFFLLYIGMGSFISNTIPIEEQARMPFNPGDLFILIGSLGLIFSIALGSLTLVCSKYIGEQKNYNFIFVIAILNGLSGILGILLAVFTLIEITKPEVKALFNNTNNINNNEK